MLSYSYGLYSEVANRPVSILPYLPLTGITRVYVALESNIELI